MKKFNNFSDAFSWINKIISETNNKAIEQVARQAYDDSKQFIYIDTQAMYNSGNSSDFAKGLVVIKAPQVRWLYYTSGITPRGNKQAVPQWFERTKIENMENYIKIYTNLFNNNKR